MTATPTAPTCGVYKPVDPHVCRCTVDPAHPTAGMPHRCDCGTTWPVRP